MTSKMQMVTIWSWLQKKSEQVVVLWAATSNTSRQISIIKGHEIACDYHLVERFIIVFDDQYQIMMQTWKVRCLLFVWLLNIHLFLHCINDLVDTIIFGGMLGSWSMNKSFFSHIQQRDGSLVFKILISHKATNRKSFQSV